MAMFGSQDKQCGSIISDLAHIRGVEVGHVQGTLRGAGERMSITTGSLMKGNTDIHSLGR